MFLFLMRVTDLGGLVVFQEVMDSLSAFDHNDLGVCLLHRRADELLHAQTIDHEDVGARNFLHILGSQNIVVRAAEPCGQHQGHLNPLMSLSDITGDLVDREG